MNRHQPRIPHANSFREIKRFERCRRCRRQAVNLSRCVFASTTQSDSYQSDIVAPSARAVNKLLLLFVRDCTHASVEFTPRIKRDN